MMKQLIAFALDGTLAPSKSALDGEMAAHLRACLTANGFAYEFHLYRRCFLERFGFWTCAM
jgi:hypothetical protein